jgi:hypothetical protein
MQFHSKVGLWLVGIVLLPVLIALARALFTQSFTPLLWVASLSAGIGLLIWGTTRYELSDTHLFVRSVFLHWDIALRDVRSIQSTHNLLSAPALSLDRLEISHLGGLVMISPKDRVAFLAALSTRAPWVKLPAPANS